MKHLMGVMKCGDETFNLFHNMIDWNGIFFEFNSFFRLL